MAPNEPLLPNTKAFFTDVFGTVVDWRSSIILALERSTALASTIMKPDNLNLHRKAKSTDWAQFAQDWRDAYYHFTHSFDPAAHASSGKPFPLIDNFFRSSLISLLESETYDLAGLYDDDALTSLNQAWHSLTPWPDSAPGLGMLSTSYSPLTSTSKSTSTSPSPHPHPQRNQSRSRTFRTCTLSNGNAALLRDLAQFGSLPYTSVFGADDFNAYKPSPLVYDGASAKMGLRSEECALIAAHLGDLKAARGCGWRTVYVERENEEQWSKEMIEEARREAWVDVWIEIGEGGFEELARRVGC